jgi:hypothetical protein
VFLGWALSAAAQPAPPAPASPEDVRPQDTTTRQAVTRPNQPAEEPPAVELPVSLDRIRKGVAAETVLVGSSPSRPDLPRFFVRVEATPMFETFLEGFDLVHGPVPRTSFTHQEFLNMVTPKELYSSAGFGAAELLQAALVSKGLAWLADRAAERAGEAKRAAEVAAVRDRIRFELNAIAAARTAQAGPPDIGALDWLAGCWQGGDGGQLIEEHWMPPRGGTLLGLSRTVTTGRTTAYEFLEIHQQADGLVYVARPAGREEMRFTLVRGATRVAHEAVFERSGVEFPQRLVYRQQPDGSLYTRLEGTDAGVLRAIDIPMRRVECR